MEALTIKVVYKPWSKRKKIVDDIVCNYDWHFSVNRIIYDAHRDKGFTSFIIEGELGAGKSVYAMKTLIEQFAIWKVYKENSIVEHREVRNVLRKILVEEDYDLCIEAWDYVKRRLCHTVREYCQIIEELYEEEKRKREKNELIIGHTVIWDDAGLSLNASLWHVKGGRVYLTLISSLLQVTRTYIRSILFTLPSKKIFGKAVWSIQPNLIQILKMHYPWSRARIYLVFEHPTKPVNYAMKYAEDYFIRHLPDTIYEKYDRIRERYAKVSHKALIDNIRFLQEKLQEGGYTYLQAYENAVEELEYLKETIEGEEEEIIFLEAKGEKKNIKKTRRKIEFFP